MSGWRGSLILLALWGMDLSWLYGWAGVIMLAGFGQPFSQAGAIWLTGSATLLTLLIRYRGWRNYRIVGAHVLGLMLACAAIVYGLEQPAAPFYRLAWLVELSTTPKTPGQWLMLAVTLVWSILLWGAGTRLALIRRDHVAISNHFDLGIIALVLLHLFEMLLAEEGGITLTGLPLPRVLFVFFTFAVLAFCLARCQGQGRSDFIVGFRGIGVVLGFMTLLLLAGSAATALFLPFLTAAAETGVAVLKTIAVPAGDLLVGILTFLFGHGRLKSDQAASSDSQDSQLQLINGLQPEGWQALLQHILMYLTVGLCIAVATVLVVLLVWQLAWWLAQQNQTAPPGPSPWQMFRVFLGKALAALAAFIGKLPVRGNRLPDPLQLYLALTAWGGRSGVVLVPSETPGQYGQRLGSRFPAMKDEILLIIAVHDQAVYGGRTDMPEQLQSARLACRRLRSPGLWPVRMKALLFR
jgi:hypothetical protein